ncbi:plc-like phosphodiesterase [Fusarium bulbicola]|nr:plc-like phosphodiesterase [Fusarium bulbicola]
MPWGEDFWEQFIPATVAVAPWSEAKPIQLNPNNYGTDFKPAMCEFHGQPFLAWATAPSAWPASFSYTTWLPSDDGWDSPSSTYIGLSRQQANTPVLVVSTMSYAGCAIYSYDGSNFNFICDWDSRWSYNQSDNDHFIWAYSEVGTTAITSSAGFSVNRIDQQTSSNPALLVRDGKVRLMFLSHNDDRTVLESTLAMGNAPTWSDTVRLGESGNSGISATSSPTGHHAWICFKTHDGMRNLMCHWKEKKQAWTANIPLGPGPILDCRNEAALVYSKSWVYAVWIVYTEGHLMYWSRRPIKNLDPESWMSCLVNQNISIAALSIPGTHDSCTGAWHDVSPSLISNLVRCQDMSITQQLNAGIRYFDIRASYKNVPARNRGQQVPLVATHGKSVVSLLIEDVLGFFYAWLDTHQTEAFILQLKADGEETDSQCVSDDFYTLIQSNLAKYWVVAETTPTLDQIKGKIQLVRRVPVPNAWGPNKPFGINAYNNWPQDAAGAVNNPLINTGPTPPSLWVEDNYMFDDNESNALQKKKRYILDFLTRATAPLAAAATPVWYIEYSSYTTDFTVSYPVPDSNFNYATENLGGTSMNHSLEETIKSKGGCNRPKCVGTIVMDYPNWKSGTLIQSIIYTNSLNLRT